MAAGLPAASLFGIGGTNIQDSDEDEDAAAARALGSMNFGRPRSKTSQAKTKLAMAKRKCWGIDDDFDALQWTPKKIIVYFKRFVVPENSQASMPATLRRDIKLHIGGHFSHCETMFELERVPERRQPPWIPKPKSKRAKKQKKKRRVAPSESQTSQYDTDVEDSDGSGNPGPPEAFRMERNAPKRSNRYPTRELNDAMTCHIVVAVKSGGPVRLLDKEAYDSTWVPIILVGMSSKERELIFDAQVQAKGRPFSTTMKFNAVVRFGLWVHGISVTQSVDDGRHQQMEVKRQGIAWRTR